MSFVDDLKKEARADIREILQEEIDEPSWLIGVAPLCPGNEQDDDSLAILHRILDKLKQQKEAAR